MNSLPSSLIGCAIVLFAGSRCAGSLRADAPADPRAANAVVRVWPDAPPSWTPPTQPEGNTSNENSRQVAGKPVIRLGHVSQPELHVFHAKAELQSDTTIVICPGGGYSILAWDLEGTEIARWLQEVGVTAVVLKYRVPTGGEDERWKPPVQDLQRSISMIRAGAVSGVPHTRVGVLGFSAGGNASARVATAPQRMYEAIDSIDEHGFLPDFAVLVYPAWIVEPDDSEKLIDAIRVTDRTPPMFFAHARDDGIPCLGSVTLFRELQKQGINSALHIFAKGGHGFGSRPNDQATDAWPELLIDWMRDLEWIK